MRLAATIFDITNTSSVQCTFISRYGSWWSRGRRLRGPMLARAWVESVYDDGSLSPQTKAALLSPIGQYPRLNLIPMRVLRREIWRGEEPAGQDESDDSGLSIDQSLVSEEIATRNELKTLREYCMDQSLQSLLDNPEKYIEGVAEAKWLVDFCPRLREKLYNSAASLTPSSALLKLLCVALESDDHVDLTPFLTLSSEDLLSLVSRLQFDGQMTRLNLSNMPALTNEGLSEILYPGPRRIVTNEGLSEIFYPGSRRILQAVYLMENPQISVETLCTLGCIYDVFHTELLRRSIKYSKAGLGPPGRLNFSHPARLPSRPPRLPLKPLTPSAGGNPVTQLIWIGLTRLQMVRLESYKPRESEYWDLLRADAEPVTYKPLATNLTMPIYNAFPLFDVPLSTTRLVTGLWNLLKRSSDRCVRKPWDFSAIAASSFAIGSLTSTFGSGPPTANGVGPLSTGLYLGNRMFYPQFEEESVCLLPELEPGQWAIIIIHECCNIRAAGRVKYALVTPTGDVGAPSASFRVLDIPRYLETIVEDNLSLAGQARDLRTWWDNNENGTEKVNFYDEDFIHNILQKIFNPAEGGHQMKLRESSPGTEPDRYAFTVKHSTTQYGGAVLTRCFRFLSSLYHFGASLFGYPASDVSEQPERFTIGGLE